MVRTGRSTLLFWALLWGCSDPASEPAIVAPEAVGSTNARPAMVEDFLTDLAATRHPSDGQGRAWIEAGGEAIVSTPGSWKIAFEAGPLGVQVGGAVYLQVSPFWGWDTPQTTRPDGPGFTRVLCSAESVALHPETIDRQLLRVEIIGTALTEGDQIVFEYGTGSMGARADLYAESASRFWIAVDGDGDGVRGVLEDSPSVRVRAGPPERIIATLTSRSRPGASAKLTLAVLDRYANAGVEFEGELQLAGDAEKLGLPLTVDFTATDSGRKTLRFQPREAGCFRVNVEARFGGQVVTAETNPLKVENAAEQLFWADLHGHSGFSDGTGTPDDYLDYARNIAALDVIALTDHDHFGMLFLDDHESLWEEIVETTAAYHEPGEFVALLGYEWTNWIYGHRHVLYFEEHGVVHSSLSEEADTPQELWRLLKGQPAVTITHHSAGDPVATDWSIPPDPTLEPVAEIMSVHGSSEAADSPRRVRGFLPENSVREALGRGYRLGFVGSGDSHDGHPGLPHLSPSAGFRPARGRGVQRIGTGGLAAIEAKELTRASVLEALRKRQVYATSGPRILLEVRFAGHRQGASVPADTLPESPRFEVSVLGTEAIERVELIRGERIILLLETPIGREVEAALELESLKSGEFLYVRVVQADGGLAWSSPIFIE